MKFSPQAKFVDDQGRLTPEAYNALQPSRLAISSMTAQNFAVEEQSLVYLPSVQAVTVKRNNVTTAMLTNVFLANPSDSITLASVQTVTIQPL